MTSTVATLAREFKHLFDFPAACRVTDEANGTYVRSYTRSIDRLDAADLRRAPMAATFVAPTLPRLRPAAAPRVATATRTAAAPRVATATRTAAAPRPAAGPVRMTRRGRLVVLAVALLVVLLPGAWRAMATAQVEGPSTVAVTVAPGDTLWGIATQIDPGADPRALIAEIRELNALAQSGLVPGQQLLVPTR